MGETAQGRKPARPQWWITWASGPLLLASGCAEHAATAELRATAPPIPTGQARIWFYRQRQRVLPRCSARTLSHRAPELWSRLQSGQGHRARRGPAGLRQDRVAARLGIGGGWRRI